MVDGCIKTLFGVFLKTKSLQQRFLVSSVGVISSLGLIGFKAESWCPFIDVL